MPVETPSLFAQVIRDHLELKERNSRLEQFMPLERYRTQTQDPFDNHPLFKSEEQARLEETVDGDRAVSAELQAALADDTVEHAMPELDDALWSRSRDFDWG